MTEKKRTGRPPTGWVKVGIKLSPEAAALLSTVPPLMKSATVNHTCGLRHPPQHHVLGDRQGGDQVQFLLHDLNTRCFGGF